MGPARRNASEKLFLGFYRPCWPREARRKLFQTEIQQVTRKSQPSKSAVGLQAQVLWVEEGAAGLPFSAWLIGSNWQKLLGLVFIHLR